MIDWLKLRVPINAVGRIPADTVMLVSPDGEVKWQKLRALEMRGSFDSNLHLSCCPVTGSLVIDGNPVKFFQGHNVFGTDDIHGLVHGVVRNVVQFLELQVTAECQAAIDQERIEIARVDVTRMYSFGSLAHATAAVRAIGEYATMKHRGRGVMKEGTAYFGKHSRRSALKVYAKGAELRDHRLADELPLRQEIEGFASDKLRVEVVLRGMELKSRGLDVLANWSSETGATLHREFIGKITVPDNIELPPSKLEGLPPRLQLAYAAWVRGDDLRVTLPRRTFYRYRAELLKLGIDILVVRPAEAKSNVLPLVRILYGHPADVPQWAVGTPAYFEPRRRIA